MPSLPSGYALHRAHGLDALPIHTFHDIARLRQEVFVVEQECAYLDLDGLDADPSTVQYWITAPGGQIAATLRVLGDPADASGTRTIGRVATAMPHRGRALAGTLMTAVLEDHGAAPLVLHAQSHLTGWYGGFGFTPSGPEYLDDGIPHTPMRREAAHMMGE